MAFAEIKAECDGRGRAAESHMRSIVKARGADALANALGGGPMAGIWQTGFSRSGKARELYRLCRGWIYDATRVIAQRVSGQTWMAGHYEPRKEQKRRYGNLSSKGYNLDLIPPRIRKAVYGNDIEPEEEHDVLWVLDKPNHVQGKSEFLQMMVFNILLTGEWYWIGGQTKESKMEIWAVPSSWVVPDHSKGAFSGYKLETGYGEGVPLQPETVARGYFVNPSDPKACLSPLETVIAAAKIDDYIQRSQETSFERGIHPNLIVTIGKTIGPDGKQENRRPVLAGRQRTQIIRSIQHAWNTTVNQGMPAIIDGLIEDIKKLNNTPQEMDWKQSGEVVKARILQAFGVNPIILGEVTPSNKAQAVVAESSFCRNTVNPIIENISCAAASFFTPFYDDGDTLAVWVEQATAKDEEMEFRQMQFARQNEDITQEEHRSYLNLPPIDEKDKPPARSPMMNNPTVLREITAMCAQVAAGALSHDNAVQLLITTTMISEEEAEAIVPDDPPEPPPGMTLPGQQVEPVGGIPPALPGGPQAAPKPNGQAPAKPKPQKPPKDEDADKGFNENQPRDDHGRWTGNGGPSDPESPDSGWSDPDQAGSSENWKVSLTEGQTSAVNAWVTGGSSMEEIRAHERGERESDRGRAFQEALDLAPNAEGIIHRGIGGLDEEDIDSITNVGTTVEIEHSMSFSGKQATAETFAHKKTYDDESFVVMTMRAGGTPLAKDITAANRYGEKEVVLRRGARIKVESSKSIELDGKLGYHVEVSLVG